MMVNGDFDMEVDGGFAVIAQVLEMNLLGTVEMDLTAKSKWIWQRLRGRHRQCGF
ncbi:hypothetical protein [Pseudomonas alkylphenolica]|uniref:hypothetical protein n=1 Tax=Pseudomonas alkylphenolica TaxID=237609 RepID=UPI0013E3086C|nr:hypothetical protein [Pseudomonas alkylphenolica]